MPTSCYTHIPQVLDEVYRLQPERTIELGVGIGKWGVLLREVLDAIYGRCHPHEWQRKIYGIEVYPAYQNPCWDLYTKVAISNFADDRLGGWRLTGWDLVMMMDSLEHLKPEVGRPFLAGLVERNKHVIISVPNGPMPQDEAVYGNEHEKHLWTFNGLEEFPFEGTKLLYQGLCTVVSIPGKAK
jgi:hypothetical protein